MPPFSESGFLGEDSRIRTKNIKKKFSRYLDVVREINKFAQSTQHKIKIAYGNKQELIVALLYSRLLSNTQASVKLLNCGMPTQASILLRVVTETLFNLAAISQDKTFVDSYIDNHNLGKLSMIKNALKSNSPYFKEPKNRYDLLKSKIEIEKQFKDRKKKKISTWKIAEIAGLEEYYRSAYTLLSDSVHSSLTDLEIEHTVKDETGNHIVGLKNEPSEENLASLYIMVCELMLVALSVLEKIFEIDTLEFVDEHKKIIDELPIE